jgi:hypothetical protein
MVHLINIEISKKRLIGRIFYGLFWAGLILFFFYYLPTHFEALIAPHVPQVYFPMLESLAQSISQSALPYLGILLAGLAFVETVINGTWVYGVILVITGFFWLIFDIILFSTGLLFSNLLPSSLLESYQLSQSETAFIVWMLVFMVIIFVVFSITTIVRGAQILVRYRGRLEQRKFSQRGSQSFSEDAS